MSAACPTKALLNTAEIWEHFKHPEEQGLHCQNPVLDLPLVLKRKDAIVDQHAAGIALLMKRQKVEVIQGFARPVGPRPGRGLERRRRARPRG